MGLPPSAGARAALGRGWETAGGKGRFQLEKQQRASRLLEGRCPHAEGLGMSPVKRSRGKWSGSAPSRGFLSLLQLLPVAQRLQRVCSAPGRGAKAGSDGGGAAMERACWKIARHSLVEFFPFILTRCLAHSRLSRSPGALAMDTGHVSRSRFSGESSPGSPGRVWGRAAGAHTEVFWGEGLPGPRCFPWGEPSAPCARGVLFPKTRVKPLKPPSFPTRELSPRKRAGMRGKRVPARLGFALGVTQR